MIPLVLRDDAVLLNLDDTVKDSHIDWGTGASQVSAVDMPIADAGTLIAATEVEGALQEIFTLHDDHITGGYHDQVTTLSSNLVVNGTFDTDSDWDMTGDAIIDATTDFRAELNTPYFLGEVGTWSPTVALTIEIGKQYILSFDCGLTVCELTATIGGFSTGALVTGGSLTFIFTATTTDDLVFSGEVLSTKKTAFWFDNVEVRELGTITGYVDAYGLYLRSDVELAGDYSQSIGDTTKGIKQIHLGALPASALPNFSGLVCRQYTGGDMYVGNDNAFPGYYVQKTVVHDSVATDNSDDYTNLYQGDSGYQRIAMMYAIENVAGVNGVEIGGGTTDPPPLLFRTFSDFQIRLDRTNGKTIWVSASHAYFEIGLNHTTNQEAVRPDTDNKIDLGDPTNNLIWQAIYAYIMDATTEYRVGGTKVVGAQGAGISDAVTAHTITDPADSPIDADALRDDLVLNTIPSIESALDALGTKINAVITALETHGLLATV